MSTQKSTENIPSNVSSNGILCYHINRINQIQVLRISSNKCFFERVIFPEKRLLFEAKSESQLEIHTGAIIGSTSEKFPVSGFK